MVLALGITGVTGYFRLGSETQALRDSLMASIPGHWHKRLALRVGFCTTALIRTVAQGLKIEPEARAALQSLRGAEFGLYELQQSTVAIPRASVLLQADKAMLRCGWERIVGVVNEHEVVGIYCPRRGLSTHRVKCALLVLQGRQMVVVGASANPQPLAEIAAHHLDLSKGPFLARR